MNDTMRKFGYPASLIKEYGHWVVLVRRDQVTLGSLVLACKDEATAFSDIPAGAFGELQQVVRDVEASLRSCLAYDKINYLMLMMVDREVHFHVIPRYAGPRELAGLNVPDKGWPRRPDMEAPTPLTDEQVRDLRDALRRAWS
ncbi:MAG: HIT family protein [Alphaproteobacteria bacterium]|nr:HIT family protein [Alphaproteobacteria bacterium]